MNPARPTRAVPLLVAVALTASLALPGASSNSPQRNPATSALCDQALDLAYNLDHDEALALLRKAVALAPDDAAAHRALASVLWLNILFRRGAVTVDHYLGAFSGTSMNLPKPSAEIDAEFRTHVSRAIALAEAQTRKGPADPQARYDLGAALGLQASYVATVEGRMLAGVRAARQSYSEHEQVLRLDPSRKDAGLIVGTYRYLISTLTLPMRALAYVAGFGGGRERGIELLEQAAHDSHVVGGTRSDARTEAMFALVLVYNRERRYNDAMAVLRELRRQYPRNRLVLLEQGATALRANRAQEADTLLSEGLMMAAKDQRAHIPGEDALWHYKRGAARAALGRTDASDDLLRASGADAQPWVRGRAKLELGRLAMARGDRSSASAGARDAEALCRQGNDPACIADARILQRSTSGR
jgi:tetratricopeptide (TPR) repeat protein